MTGCKIPPGKSTYNAGWTRTSQHRTLTWMSAMSGPAPSVRVFFQRKQPSKSMLEEHINMLIPSLLPSVEQSMHLTACQLADSATRPSVDGKPWRSTSPKIAAPNIFLHGMPQPSSQHSKRRVNRRLQLSLNHNLNHQLSRYVSRKQQFVRLARV